MIVVDTNVVSYLYLTGDRSQQAEQLLSLDSHWCAPVLWRSEFRSVLSLYLRKNLLTLEEVMLILEQAEELLGDHEYEVPSDDIMRLVNQSECSAYDCEFVALAKYLGVPLVTADKKLLREFPGVAKSLETC
ncbi:MAG: type II toxin-antitoxin system VapC family toxin [Xanthomonadales bacterium]|nr:type II toxin-antitoxin system VapC family toxin [Xanthomonadales bacterium]MDH4018181.1 type II toxin-antitoxin system VapC family toxin [Xanthomonadales bacterium]